MSSRLVSSLCSTVPRLTLDIIECLTSRELVIYQLIVQGWTQDEIAQIECISIKSVQVYISKIKVKLNCANRSELCQLAWRNGLVEYFLKLQQQEKIVEELVT